MPKSFMSRPKDIKERNMKKNRSKLNNFKTKSHYLFVMFLIIGLVQTSCSEEEEEIYELAISESRVHIAKEGGSAVIAVTASEPWGQYQMIMSRGAI